MKIPQKAIKPIQYTLYAAAFGLIVTLLSGAVTDSYNKGYTAGENNATTNFVTPKPAQQPKTKTIEVLPKNIVALFTFEDLVEVFIKRHPHISSENTQLILKTIKETSERYNINPTILYAIAYKESSMRWWITHRGTNDPAVGLMGIRWGIWKDGLIAEKIASERSDLYQIVPNIQASGYALSESINQGKHKLAKNKTMSGIIRYNGADNLGYYNKINTVVVNLLKEKIYND